MFARDLYEAFTGLLADGDIQTARAATLFLFDQQQLANGSMPRNSLLNGQAAPDTGGTQLDEAAYPILMALQAGLGGDASLYENHIRPAADFLVANGPSFGVERWEEQTGYSPSTIAAEIAGLTAASVIAKTHGDTARAQLYQATADDFQRMIKTWTVTTTGPDGSRYFIRLSKTGDPNAAITYSLGNGGPTVDQRSVIDGGFQELTRLGELPISDPDVQESLNVLDKQISVVTPSGTGYYRYGTSAAKGSADGYGDCFQPSQTSCTTTGAPWPPTDTGTGHLWPNLSGERAESDLAEGHTGSAADLLEAIINFSSGVGLVPEQAWEDPDLAASPFGSDPATASIGFTDGKAAGSASPLTWAQAQELRLILSLGTGRNVDTPAVTTARYVTNGPPTALKVTITSPASGATLAASSTTVTGTTTPGAQVSVASDDTTTGAPASVTSTTAAADGSFEATVPVSFGSNVITVSATAAGGRSTGYAQVTVTNEGGGTSVLDVTDPTGDDNGPGTYQYPTDSSFAAGSFDLTRFQVLSDGTFAYLRVTLRTLVPTFGALDGAQLLDVYVHVPGATATSTAAAFAVAQLHDLLVRGLEPAARGAGLRRAGVGERRRRCGGDRVGAARPVRPHHHHRRARGPVRHAGLRVGLQRRADRPGRLQLRSGTRLHRHARGVHVRGLRDPAGARRSARSTPSTVPKAMDVITPPGVTQATELDPTLGPVVIQPVTVP